MSDYRIEKQARLFDPPEVANKLSTRGAYRVAVDKAGPGAESSDIALELWMAMAPVIEFHAMVPAIHTVDAAESHYREHLNRMPCFESIARRVRDLTRHGEQDAYDVARPNCVGWYDVYLNDTAHWRTMRSACLDHYQNCALCGSILGPLDTHHKHYHTLGVESVYDLSLLCHPCHGTAHRCVSLFVPRRPPVAVRAIFDAEGIDYAT